MICIKLQGRLGNQLFQYAFAYTFAKKLKVKFYFDKREKTDDISRYFTFNLDDVYFLDNYLFKVKGFKNLFTYHLRIKFYNMLVSIFKLKQIAISDTETPENEIKKVNDMAFYIGYFQSEKYFIDCKKQIIKKFEIKSNFVKSFNEHFAKMGIRSNYVVVHIRRSDYVSLGHALPMSYFHKAIASITNENCFYVFISDDYDCVVNEFAYLENKYISRQTEIIDFQFLLNAQICIISNSTFSWWGSYLNKNNPKVICPKYWIGQKDKIEYPRDIIPPNWIKIDTI